MAVDEFIHKWLGVPYTLSVQFDEGVGDPIIMLHGIAASSTTWDSLQLILYPRYRAMGVDLLGFGSSPKPVWSSYSIDQHVSAIHHTIHRKGLPRPFMLVGHSMGSLIAVHYARKYPKEVNRLVMLSPPIMTNLATSKPARFSLSTNAYARVYRYLREHKRFTLKGIQSIRRMLKGIPFTMTEAMWIPFVRSLEECIEKQTAIDEDLRTLLCPVDVFYGTKDHIISLTNIRSLNTIHNLTLHPVTNARHSLTQPYAKAVSDFIESLAHQ